MNAEKPLRNKQIDELRKLVLKRFCLSFIAYSLALFALYAAFDSFLSPAIGNIIADNTSRWEYIPAREIDTLWSSHRMIQLEPYTEESDSSVRYRALDTYAFMKEMKDNALPVLFVTGITALILYSLNKYIGYFNELSTSVASLFKNKKAPISLSKELHIVQSELRSIQEESLKNEKAAEEETKRKNELLAYIAHDLRTPLTSILGYSSLLCEETTRNDYPELIHSQALSMNAMLDDFFEIARLNMIDFKLDKRIIDVRTLFLQISDDFYPAALEKGLSFNIDVPLNLTFAADAEYLTRAIANIIRNAIFFAVPKTSLGMIADIQPNQTIPECIEGETRPTDVNVNSGGAQLNIRISNQGKTISPEALPHVFEAFYREDPSRNTGQGNAGLGLAISRSIVLAHGGSIDVRSERGVTEFTIALPFHDATAKAHHRAQGE